METQETPQEFSIKNLISDSEIELLCENTADCLKSSNPQDLIQHSKTLLKSLLLISSYPLASKAFSVLLSTSEYFYCQNDSKNTYKYLSGANLLINYIKDPDLITRFSSLKSKIFTRLSPVQHLYSESKKSETFKPDSKGLISDFSRWSSGISEKKTKKLLRRPSSGGKYSKTICPNSNILPLSANKPKDYARYYGSRPNSAKRRKPASMDFGDIYIQPSYFKLPDKEIVKVESSSKFIQNVQILTPPKTPDGLVKIVLVNDRKYQSKDRKSVGMEKCAENKEEKLLEVQEKHEKRPKKREKINDRAKSEVKDVEKGLIGSNKLFEVRAKVAKKESRNLIIKSERKPVKVSATNQYNKGYFTNLLKNKKTSEEFQVKPKKIQVTQPKMQSNPSESLTITEQSSYYPEKLRKCGILKRQISASYLSKLIKIQKFFRGHLARERFNLMKSKIPSLRTCAILIDSQIFHVRILKSSDSFIISSYSDHKSHKQVLKKFENSEFSLLNFSIKSGELIYSSIKRESSLLFSPCGTLEATINKEKVQVNYSQNLKNRLLKAEIVYFNSNYELLVPIPANKDLSFFIKHCVNNYLAVTENKFELVYPKVYLDKVFLYSVNCKQSKKYLFVSVYIITTNETREIEVCIFNITTKTQSIFFFNDSMFKEYLSESIFQQSNSFIYFLALDLKTPGLLITKLNFKLIGSIKKQIRDKDYILRCFLITSNKGKYLFECLNSESSFTSSIQLSPTEIKKTLKISPKNIESNIEKLLSLFTIKKDCLVPIKQEKLLTSKLTQSVINLNVIKKIQRKFRERFNRNKQNLSATDKTVLYKSAKIINGITFDFTVFRLDSGLVVEAFNQRSKEQFFKYIENPLDYISVLNKIADLRKLIEATKIVDNKLVITRAKVNLYAKDPENSVFIDVPFVDDEDFEGDGWPVLIKKELGGVDYILKANIDAKKNLVVKLLPYKGGKQSLYRKFDKDEVVRHIGIYDPKALIPSLRVSYGNIVTSDLIRYSVPALAEELLGIHTICKIAVKSNSSMYIICASLVEDLDNYENSELRFYARLNSSLERCRKTTISLSQASLITKIDSRSIQTLSEYICKNMIIITSDEFYIDCSKPPIILESLIIKLQALIRGYRTRQIYAVKIFVIFKENIKIQSSSFTVLIYTLDTIHYLAAVSGFNVFKSKLSELFMDNFYKSVNKKVFVFEEVMKNLKSSDRKFTFLDGSKTSTIYKRRPTIELAQASIVPNVMTYLHSSTMKRNEGANLLHTFEIKPNCVVYAARIFRNESKVYVEVSCQESIIKKDIKENIKDFENFVKFIHVDLAKEKLIFRDKTLFNRIISIDGHRVSVIIFENKNGLYLDGFIIDSHKPHFFYLGENAKVNSIMTKLKISSGKLVLRN